MILLSVLILSSLASDMEKNSYFRHGEKLSSDMEKNFYDESKYIMIHVHIHV